MQLHVELFAKILFFTTASFAVSRMFRKLRMPPVLGMLGTGFMLRYLHPNELLETTTDPLVDIALAAMGLEIGSHLNETTIGSVAGQMVRFMLVFVTVVVTVVSIGIRGLMPEMVPFAALAASIAVERSSPECLQGITEAQAKGPFCTSLMCISAMQDVGAILCFVLSEIILGSTSFRSGMEHIGLMLASTALACALAVVTGKLFQHHYPSLCAAAMCMVLASAAEFTPSELLLSAVCSGAFLNYRRHHASTALISRLNQVVGVVLFTWMGYRMNIASFLGITTEAERAHSHLTPRNNIGPHQVHQGPNLWIIIGIYLLRLFALFLGSLLASLVVGLRQQAAYRWMGLVTQLAIALSLVQRGERSFPHAAPLMRAYGGAVLLSLITGPALLQLVLHKSGEVPVASEAALSTEAKVKESLEV
jgi:hypothetical protein